MSTYSATLRPLAAALAGAAVPSFQRRRWQTQCQESASLPAWMAPGGLPKVDGAVKDPSRREKEGSYDRAQVSHAAIAHNATLPNRDGGPTSLRVVSYNIHFHADNNLTPNLSRVLEAINIMDADVVALQEAGLPPGLEKSGGMLEDAESKPDATRALHAGALVEGLMSSLWSFLENASSSGRASAQDQGQELLEGMQRMGYHYCVWSPGFTRSGAPFSGFREGLKCGNAVFSKRPFLPCETLCNGVVMMDKNRAGEDRTAAFAVVDVGGVPLAVASAHLDVWAEMCGYFGMAEGEVIRLLEMETLHHTLKHMPNIMILADFNSPTRLSATCSAEHARIADLCDRLSAERDPKALRHFLPRDVPRLLETMTALGFAEQHLGYRHCWQELPIPMAPLYSHWSGQLIDHCLLRSQDKLRVKYASVFHTSASDHLPLVVDIEI